MPFLILTKNNEDDEGKKDWFFLADVTTLAEARQFAIEHILQERFGEDGWKAGSQWANPFALKDVRIIEYTSSEEIPVRQVIVDEKAITEWALKAGVDIKDILQEAKRKS